MTDIEKLVEECARDAVQSVQRAADLTLQKNLALANAASEAAEARATASESEAAALRERLWELSSELEWYGEQARLARLIHSEGNAARRALAEDGGRRARTALEGRKDG